MTNRIYEIRLRNNHIFLRYLNEKYERKNNSFYCNNRLQMFCIPSLEFKYHVKININYNHFASHV